MMHTLTIAISSLLIWLACALQMTAWLLIYMSPRRSRRDLGWLIMRSCWIPIAAAAAVSFIGHDTVGVVIYTILAVFVWIRGRDDNDWKRLRARITALIALTRGRLTVVNIAAPA